MKRWIVIAALAACDAGLPPAPTETTPAPAPSLAPIPDGQGGWFAVLEVTQTYEECSNYGGQHAELSVVRDPREPHPSGEGDGIPRSGHLGRHGEWNLGLAVGDRVIAEIQPQIPAEEEKGYEGWCIPATRHDAAIVRRGPRLATHSDSAQALADFASETTRSRSSRPGLPSQAPGSTAADP